VVAAGRLDDPELDGAGVKEEKADFIGIGRGLIADPIGHKKWPTGESGRSGGAWPVTIVASPIHTPRPIRCAVNAAAGRECKYETIGLLSRKGGSVVGGGPAGMEAARVAAIKRHQ